MEKPVLLTIPEASERSGIPYSLLRGAVKTGRVQTIVFSKQKLIPLGALQCLLEEIEKAGEARRQ
jgi:hypothetical protein